MRWETNDDPYLDPDNLDWRLNGIDAREVNSNLPDVEFYAGRQLDASDTGPWDEAQGQYPPIVIGADEAVIATGLEIGDRLTFEIAGSGSGPMGTGQTETQNVTFEIAGMVDRRGSNISVNFGAQNYAPKSRL